MSNPTQGNHTYRTVDMTPNGIFQGYRWCDLHDTAPLFPFGHGLSYTQFAYSQPDADARTVGAMTVSFDVTNSGAVAGDEVPQVYVGTPPSPPVPMAVRALGGFDASRSLPARRKHVDGRGRAERRSSTGTSGATTGRPPGATARSPSARRRATSG